MLRVSFIGRGNVGTRMAERLREVGAEVAQVCSLHGPTPVSALDPTQADVVIVAVADDAIAPVLAQVKDGGNALWLHTSGSVGIDVFDSRKFPRHGVLYPLQTLQKARPVDWAEVPLLIEGADEALEPLARQMSPRVSRLDSESRRRLHAAAVVCCNMAMYLWSLSEQIATDAGLPYSTLHPLIELTARRATEGSPGEMMTGPARRGDIGTIRKHLEVLPPEAAEVYRFLTNQILKQYHPTVSV